MNKASCKWYDWLDNRLKDIAKLRKETIDGEDTHEVIVGLQKLTLELSAARRQSLWEAHDDDKWQVEGYIGQFEEEIDRDAGISHHFNYFYVGCPNRDAKVTEKWRYDYKRIKYHPFNDISSYLDQNENEYVRVTIEKIPIEQRTCTSCDERFKCYTERT